jgi:Gpi18-like mannosyltransferase
MNTPLALPEQLDRTKQMPPQVLMPITGGGGMALVTVVLILCGAIWLYSLVWPVTSGDMRGWLVPWYEHIMANGRIATFSAPFANYTPPYLYLLSAMTLFDGVLPVISLIKLLSILGACALAAAAYYLLRALRTPNALQAGAWVLLLPSVVFNAPILGQCDVIWTAACLMAVAEAIKHRVRPMLFWCGVAVAFKAQAVFIAPFVLAVLLERRTPLYLWAIPPAVFAVAMLPAWAAGWPAQDLATIYLRQAEWAPEFIGNAANPWSIAEFVGAGAAAAEFTWVGFAAAALATIAYLCFYTRHRLSQHELLTAALVSSMMLPFLLPKMHERFFFLADILAFAFAWTVRNRSAVAVAALVQLSSVMAAAGLNAWAPGGAAGCALSLAALSTLLTYALRNGGGAASTVPSSGPKDLSTPPSVGGSACARIDQRAPQFRSVAQG